MKKGFTLIELMVIVAIMLIMTSVVLFNYTQFNESTLLSAFAYDMSLTIRQAQTYGVATKEGVGGNISLPITVNDVGSKFKSAYGVHFDLNSPNQFFMFLDNTSTGVVGEYDSNDIILQMYTFQRGINIKKLCFVPDNGSGGSCGGSDPGKKADSLDIIFLRPNPEATFTTRQPVNHGVSAATIYLQNAGQTITKSVVVYSTGQIAVK